MPQNIFLVCVWSEGGGVERDLLNIPICLHYKDQSECMQMRQNRLQIWKNVSTCSAAMRENTFEGSLKKMLKEVSKTLTG